MWNTVYRINSFTHQESCPPVEIFQRETAFLIVFTAVLSHDIINTENRIEKKTGEAVYESADDK